MDTILALLRAPSRLTWTLIGVVGLIAALWIGLILYGNARYRAGVEDTDAKWVAAGEKLKAQAAKSATRADQAEARRIEDHTEQLAAEKERIDAAISEGRSPLDALFPAADRVRHDPNR